MTTTARQVRLAKTDDLAAIEQCAVAAYTKYVERMGKTPAPMIADFEYQIHEGLVHVIETATDMLGFVVFYPRGDHLHLENIAIHPNFAGQGAGGELIRFVEITARDGKFAAVELYTNEKMTENLSLYPKLGYTETERKTEAGFHRVYFRKNVGEKTDRQSTTTTTSGQS